MRWRTHWVFCALFVSSIVAAQDQSSPCERWKAWVTHPASGPAILNVTAECQLPTPGHKVELVPDPKQDSDPTVFVLNEVVHPPEGMVAQVITPYKLHYRKKIRKNYKEVLIQPSGTHVTIEERSKGSAEAPPSK
jgi:hypothetical protein